VGGGAGEGGEFVEGKLRRMEIEEE